MVETDASPESALRTRDTAAASARVALQRLFAALHQIFYDSLLAENQRRIQHVDYAVHKIERDSQARTRQRNRLRQEEITDEIEVIMLSAETRQQPGR